MENSLIDLKKKASAQEGFTLLEILVVLTVMGFLIAMVAPRLAGISGDASETVCDTNKNRTKTYVSAFYEKFGRYPNGLTNLVMTDGADIAAANAGATGYQIPYCSDDDPDNGAEVIHSNHNNSYKFMIHRLNSEEAAELKKLGITKVYNLNDYASNAPDLDGAAAAGRDATHTSGQRVTNWGNITAITAKRPYLEECEVAAGVGVAMGGAGISAPGGTAFTYVQVERGWAEPDLFGRMIFGLGPESELVTTGIISNAAHSPGSIQNSDNFSWGGYFLILPRLESTVDRLETATFATVWGSGSLSYASLSAETLEAVSWDSLNPPSANYGITANSDNYRVRTDLKLGKAMPAWDFDTTRQRDDDVWGIDLMNSNHVLNGG